MLRIVHPAPSGQGSGPPKRRKGQRSGALSLSADEIRHLRAALQNLRFALGGWDVVAEVTGIRRVTLEHAGSKRSRRPHAAIAIRAARAAGISVEALLSGKMRPTDRCPTCGTHAADRRKGGA